MNVVCNDAGVTDPGEWASTIAPAHASMLDNPVWWALTGSQRHLAQTAGRAVRYRCDVSVFSGTAQLDDEGWADLARLAHPGGEVGLIRDEVPPTPDGWTEIVRGRGQQMLFDAGAEPDVERFEFRRLTDHDLPQMLALVELTIPGPFLARTIETGRYYGHFEGEQLLALAGERFRPGHFTEVSAVCTHPDHRKRGLGSAITHHVATGIVQRGDQPFLHVASTNDTARRVYERLGWMARCEMEFVLATAPT